MIKERILWGISSIFTAMLSIILISLWSSMNQYQVHTQQLVNNASVDSYLKNNTDSRSGSKKDSIQQSINKIKTGLFIQNVEFVDSDKVSISGYIWQHDTDKVHKGVNSSGGEIGFKFPQQVKINAETEPHQVYRIKQSDSNVSGWYFDVVLRQLFDYTKYPFDHKTVKIQIRPKEITKGTILVPDFQSYRSTGPQDVFGIAPDIILSEWNRENTYFSYDLSTYDTNFGIYDFDVRESSPELSFNFVLKRKFESAFIYNLLPILLILILLYGAFLSVNDKNANEEKHGFSSSNVVGICISLLGVFIALHLQLRQSLQNPGGLVYIEYFYVFVYLLLILVTANALSLSNKWTHFLHRNNNLILKTMYWPIVLLYFVMVTLMHDV